jgi:hypothetical protein
MLAHTDSPSAHSRPASAGLRTSSRLAPLATDRTLRTSRSKDARCVRPTSATQSNCVHPAPRVFPDRSRHFRGGDTPRRVRLRDVSGGPDVSRHPRPLRRIVRQRCVSCSSSLTAWSHERGLLVPTTLRTIEPLASLSRAPVLILTPLSPSRELPSGRRSCSSQVCYGSEEAETAKLTVHVVS